MLQLLEFTHKNIIATRADSMLSAAGYAKILPLVHNIESGGEKVRWYFEINDNAVTDESFFLNIQPPDGYDYATAFPRVAAMERIAIVAPEKWQVFLFVMIKKLAPEADIQCFALADHKKAMQWIEAEKPCNVNALKI